MAPWIEILSAVATALAQLALWHPEIFAKIIPFISEQRIIEFKDKYPQYLVWVPLGILIFAIVLRYIRGKKIKDLEMRIEGLNSELLSMQSIKDNVGLLGTYHLLLISRDLNATAEERVSLYVFRRDKSGARFFDLVGRFSYSDSYKQPGRSTYPFGQGVIGLAWDKGEVEIFDLPDWCLDQAEYIRKSKDIGNLKTKYVKQLSMHPRYLFGCRIADEDNRRYDSVLVVESMDAGFGRHCNVRSVLQKYKAHLYSFVDDMKDVLPTLAKAREKGF